jgi:hypothetical protein
MIGTSVVGATDLRKSKYKIPAFSVDHPSTTYITIDQAMSYTGDNSKYSKRCLYILSILWVIHSMLTMGFP